MYKVRYVSAATKSGIDNKIVNGFRAAGCTDIKIVRQENTFCKLELTLPSGKRTSVTVSYEYNVVKNGKGKRVEYVDWDPSYTVDGSGIVYDIYDEPIGTAVVQIDGEAYDKHKKDYLIKSIKTNVGNLIIDHPETANNNSIYKSVVNSLEHRTVIQRS